MPSPPRAGGILDYQRPRPPPPHNGVGAALGAGLFFLGFFAGPIATLLVGGATQSASALWIIPALALFLACVPPVRALGAGMLVGIGTVVLIVGSICGGWWR